MGSLQSEEWSMETIPVLARVADIMSNFGPTWALCGGWSVDARAWDAAKVRDALRRLPAVERDAIGVADLGGRTYRQVAAELRMPEGTAKAHIRAGLARLGEYEPQRRVAEGRRAAAPPPLGA